MLGEKGTLVYVLTRSQDIKMTYPVLATTGRTVPANGSTNGSVFAVRTLDQGMLKTVQEFFDVER
jgi:hypothetical protein